MLDGILQGLGTAMMPINLFMVVVGCFVGTFIGMLPGLGPVTAIALMIPITYGLDPASGIILMAGVYYGSMFGGSTASILINTPGCSASMITAIDGYPLACKGQAGKALAIAAYASFVGGAPARQGLPRLPVGGLLRPHGARALRGGGFRRQGPGAQGADHGAVWHHDLHRRHRPQRRGGQIHLRSPGLARWFLLPAAGHGHLRPGRDPDDGAAPGQGHQPGGGEQDAAARLPQAESGRGKGDSAPHSPLLGAGVPHRRAAGGRCHHRLLHGLWGRAQLRPQGQTGRVWQGQSDRHSRAGSGQQRRLQRGLRAAADPGDPGLRHHGPDAGGPHRLRHPARPASVHGAP